MTKRLASLLFLLALAAALPSFARAQNADFDFYVLSLSWSPTWCAANDESGRTAQCDGRRKYTFIAHGLWPQSRRGWLADCESDQPRRVSEKLARSYLDILPSVGLAGHEWRKHGTCSGLTQDLYFQTLRRAYNAVALPPVIFDGSIDRRLGTEQIEKLFIKANPGLSTQSIAVTCENGRLEEVRICMSKGLDFTACPDVDRRSCRQKSITIPAIR